MEPAAAFEVPRAERKMLGGGESDFRLSAQVLGSALTMGERLGDEVAGERRAKAWILEEEGCASRVLRILEPTSPVPPTRAIDGCDSVMLGLRKRILL